MKKIVRNNDIIVTMNEEYILNYIKDKNSDAKNIYKKLLEGYIPSQKVCEIIIENKLTNYLNLICEYHLGPQVQNKLYDARTAGKSQTEIINLIMKSATKKIPVELEDNIKNAIETFILSNIDVDKEQVEIINLYLESVTIDEKYEERIAYLLSVTHNDKLREILEVHIGIDPLLDR